MLDKIWVINKENLGEEQRIVVEDKIMLQKGG